MVQIMKGTSSKYTSIQYRNYWDNKICINLSIDVVKLEGDSKLDYLYELYITGREYLTSINMLWKQIIWSCNSDS